MLYKFPPEINVIQNWAPKCMLNAPKYIKLTNEDGVFVLFDGINSDATNRTAKNTIKWAGWVVPNNTLKL